MTSLEDDARNKFRDGVKKFQKNNLVGAKADFKESLRLDPTSSKVNFNLGVVEQALDNHDLAIECYEKAVEVFPLLMLLNGAKFSDVELDPTFSDAYHNLALLYAQRLDADLAVKNYKKALDNNPSNPAQIWNNYGACLESICGDPEQAKAA